MDTISRQAAIDAMYKLCDECDPDECGECRLVYDYRSDKSRDSIYVLEHLPAAQPEYTDAEIQKMQDLEQAQIEKTYQLGYEEGRNEAQRWIPVKEKLPEKEDRFLCTVEIRSGNTSGLYIEICTFYKKPYLDEGFFKWEKGLKREENVIAWMPLPEPYKEGEQNE